VDGIPGNPNWMHGGGRMSQILTEAEAATRSCPNLPKKCSGRMCMAFMPYKESYHEGSGADALKVKYRDTDKFYCSRC